jgi:hypothetical protein
MLVLVHFKGLNTDLLTIPRCTTPQLQVLDVVVTNHSKTDYGAYTGNGWYLKNCLLMPAGNIRRPSEALLWQWIKTACHDSSQESTAKGLKKCYVSKQKASLYIH